MGFSRRTTTEIQVFHRAGSEAVAYDLSQPHRVTITVPTGSLWTSGPHWHESHTEYLQIKQGRALVRLGPGIKEYSAQDGIIQVPRYAVHEWQRVPHSEDGEDLIVQEWTIPEDGDKEAFFRMLNSFLTEQEPQKLYHVHKVVRWMVGRWVEQWVVMLQLFAIFQAWDNYPVFLGDDSGWIGWLTTHLVLGIASMAGLLIGVRGDYPEYTGEQTKSKEKPG
ncbi:hypothetical protein B0A52_04001 [Exophiala mesophila]|uniref:Cupin 2 conserved barrel domain-containing protein n=1 Tax=Exophiala mesophila TaxID=212818 RepID=A0A438NAD4_EXOME|nr:hypothetical protein B0A52_04001 [Exophiala mesophila]